jgi:hypothetical protein
MTPSPSRDRRRPSASGLQQIPCNYGHVFVAGRQTLGAYAAGRLITGRLAALPCVRVSQRGDSEVSVVFPPEMLPTVAAPLRTRKGRRVSEDLAVAGAERLARYRRVLLDRAERERRRPGTTFRDPTQDHQPRLRDRCSGLALLACLAVRGPSHRPPRTPRSVRRNAGTRGPSAPGSTVMSQVPGSRVVRSARSRGRLLPAVGNPAVLGDPGA